MALAIAAAAPAVAAAAAPGGQTIEGVWSFNGGKVAISPAGQGFVGTIVAATRFAQCSHPVGEEMWTSIVPQADGSYWGFHQWFFESAACTANPQRGPTAWRVLTASDGSHFLRVCFSSPGSSQPTIAANGTSANVTYACADSALIAALPSSGTRASGSLALPSNRKCFSRRVLTIHLRDPQNDPFKRVLVTLAHRRLSIVRHGRVFASTVNLRGLPRGRFTVHIHATTVLGRHISGSRSYHTCALKALNRRAPRRAHAARGARG